LIQAADVSQQWMGDGCRSLVEWVAARLRLRSESANQLVRVARRLADLPVVSERFASAEVSLDQVDALSRMATPESEESLVEEALRLSNHMLDRMARHANPPTLKAAERDHYGRELFMQWNLDHSRLKMRADLPGVEGEIVQSALEERADRY